MTTEVVIVGIARVAANGLNGCRRSIRPQPRANRIIPTTRSPSPYVLPKQRAMRRAGIKQQVAKLGYVALTKDEFNKQITNFYTYKTGIGTNIC